MQRDYLIYPLLIGTHSGVIWSYENPLELIIFDNNHPLDVSANKCNSSSFCLWYVSPLWQFNDVNNTTHALMGESDKWTFSHPSQPPQSHPLPESSQEQQPPLPFASE
ncbi:unnamed protein product [Rotaria sordida]|uniref:Uncharacterized protein n=1 Tax=Rotaria sordida TaxID=392033 RepID=A0A813ZIC4_9BILA|nr:unnamed protein product [Rotaria sordida]CAF3827515.1 unnamed protein product [Rotaria sordida]